MKFQLGSVSLKCCVDVGRVVSDIFEFVIKSLDSAQHQVSLVSKERDRLAEERQLALKKLSECTKIKEETEKDLYSKFVLVLNAKKEKLRELKANGVDDNKAQQSSVKSSSVSQLGEGSAEVSRRSPPVSHADHGTDSELNTDEENESIQNAKKSRKQTKAASRLINDSESANISLVLGEDFDEDLDESIIAKRQRRTTRKVTKQPSKPIIPQAARPTPQASQSKSSLSSSKGSLKKLSTRSSNNSSNLDASDLLNDMA